MASGGIVPVLEALSLETHVLSRPEFSNLFGVFRPAAFPRGSASLLSGQVDVSLSRTQEIS